MTGMISRVFLPLALPIANGLAQTPQGPDVVIRSSAREELLEVVVRDAHGKLVTNLKPDEIAIYEDGGPPGCPLVAVGGRQGSPC